MTDRYSAYRAAPQPPAITRAQWGAILGEIARLGWTAERRAAYLENRWNVTHALYLNTVQAQRFLTYLKEQQP